ncbi:hypothetical protein Celaphus_00018039 [Cervus elaphus hippelaphus]|uniref:Uncharacterized protein n=1 Tax=Cervus elaphus hippelaphus TaxID=46360 RepID=A0A212C8D9_CEREH|nr:hypothetical protein Celaphus_00018039 [Cervus elaphus hippelaphus]
MRGQGLRNQSTHSQLMEMMTIEDCNIQLIPTQALATEPDTGRAEEQSGQSGAESSLGPLNLSTGLPPTVWGHGWPGAPTNCSALPRTLGVMSELGSEPIIQVAQPPSSSTDDKSCHGDEYQEDKNTLGFINPGTDEHKLCTDLMTEILSRRDRAIISEEEVTLFLTYYCKAGAHLDPENFVFLNDCCSVFSILATVLCDPIKAFLTPHSLLCFQLCVKVELMLVR